MKDQIPIFCKEKKKKKQQNTTKNKTKQPPTPVKNSKKTKQNKTKQQQKKIINLLSNGFVQRVVMFNRELFFLEPQYMYKKKDFNAHATSSSY